MKNKPQAIIMGLVTVAFVVGAVVFAVAQFRESSRRDHLRSDGIEAPIERTSFLEQDVRRISTNDPNSNGAIYSDDQVLFTFRLDDGDEFTAIQPIAEDTYGGLGLPTNLTALYLADDPDGAELLRDGEFVASARPHWIFAIIAGLLALASGASAWFSARPAESTARS